MPGGRPSGVMTSERGAVVRWVERRYVDPTGIRIYVIKVFQKRTISFSVNFASGFQKSQCTSLAHGVMKRPVYLSFGRVNVFWTGRNMTGRLNKIRSEHVFQNYIVNVYNLF